jgi:hypothetical protein
MTVHGAPSSASAHPSPPTTTSAREALHALLSSTLAGTPVPLTTVERGAPLAGITAFRGVRETSLWFFDGDRTGAGVLASGRPAEFWALADLAAGDAGVRVRSATGRTCSVVLMRRSGADVGNTGEEEEEEGEETEFQMIDGKEKERILEWVRRHRSAFGIAAAQVQQQQGEARATAGAAADGGGVGVGDSDSDSDFEVESAESDGGSPSSDSASDAGSGSGKDEARSEGVSESESGDDVEEEDERDGRGPRRASSHRESDAGDDDDDDDDDDEDEAKVELDPKHHPLLRAGALPKMSRAAMDAAVGLVVGDLVGQGQQRRGAPGRPVARDEQSHEDEEGDDEEEDELDD